MNGENVPKSIEKFEEAGLRELLMENIAKAQYEVPTPIQKHALPIIMADRDLIGCAQTGSGKTAAYMIPIVHKLMERPRDLGDLSQLSTVQPRAIVVVPTRELAIQIDTVARMFSKGSILKCRLAYGGTSTAWVMRQIFSGCDILVATPGRLIDILGKGKIVLSSIEYVVLDEADRMLDMGFLPDVEKVIVFFKNFHFHKIEKTKS